jgi:multicomponent Na+:H+ antiporter subunit B
MGSIIIATATRYLFPLLLTFSLFVLLRGHNEPGGGFVGGLVAASAYALYFLAFGVESAKKTLKIPPIKLVATGLSIALTSAVLPLFFGKQFMTGMWSDYKFPIFGKIGTPFLFDIGVYVLVIGIVLQIIFALAEEDTQ